MRQGPILALLLLSLAAGVVPAAAQPAGDALYEVVFDATWSAATHPQDFPPSAHFSWLIGGTHNDQAAFWAVGDTASLGIRRMAEWGSTSPLDDEVQAAIDAGHAGQIIRSDDYIFSPGSQAVTFTVTPDAPLVTLVTMIAPSPDWFTGAAGLDLRDGDGWVDELVFALWPFDAGTDSGPAYTSADQPTVPQQAIVAITGAPFAAGVPLGTFTFRRLGASSVPAAAAPALRAYPNPFNPRTTIALDLDAPGMLRLDVHDLRGRLVRSLSDGHAAAGPVRVRWDGRDDQGRQAAAGVYLVRARLGTVAAAIPLVLVR